MISVKLPKRVRIRKRRQFKMANVKKHLILLIWRPPYNIMWRSPYNIMWRPPYKIKWRPPYKLYGGRHIILFGGRHLNELYGGRHIILCGGRQIKLYGGRHIICASNYYFMWHQSASVIYKYFVSFSLSVSVHINIANIEYYLSFWFLLCYD